MAWTDYRKAYDMVPHSWIRECLKMFGVAQNIKKFLEDNMSKWKSKLSSSGEIVVMSKQEEVYSRKIAFHHCHLLFA